MGEASIRSNSQVRTSYGLTASKHSAQGHEQNKRVALRSHKQPPKLRSSELVMVLPFLTWHGGHSMNWARQQAALADRFTTIAWDARGYGNSEDSEGAREFSVFAQDLRRLLDELDIDCAHFVGLSMGARILMDFYPENKRRVATLTLCDCFSGFQSKLSPDKTRVP